MQEKREVDTDAIYRKWITWVESSYGIEEMYSSELRKDLITALFDRFLEFPLERDDIESYKRKVMEDLITEKGKKASGKKNDRRCNWYKNIGRDFMAVLDEYFDPNEGLKIEKKVVYSRSKFMLPEDEDIVAWVKEKYGDNPDLIEQAHNVNNAICLEYFSEFERKALNE